MVHVGSSDLGWICRFAVDPRLPRGGVVPPGPVVPLDRRTGRVPTVHSVPPTCAHCKSGAVVQQVPSRGTPIRRVAGTRAGRDIQAAIREHGRYWPGGRTEDRAGTGDRAPAGRINGPGAA